MKANAYKKNVFKHFMFSSVRSLQYFVLGYQCQQWMKEFWISLL